VFSVDTDNPILIQIDELRNIKRKVYLEDTLTNKVYELSTEDLVELNIAKDSYKNRFYLIFSNENNIVLSNNEHISNTELDVYLDNTNKELILKNHNNINIRSVEIYTVLGQQIKSFAKVTTEVESKFSIKNLSSGVYIVKIISEHGTLSKKIFKE
jgi:hypothetical protein